VKPALVLLAVLAAGTAHAADGFEAVHCGGDVRGALIGKHMRDEPVVETEKRHADLGLKDLGGDEITEELSSTSWRICAKEYIVISDRRGLVRDAVAFPEHSRSAPQFSASDCKANGKAIRGGVVIGVLDARSRKALLPATAAWKIDMRTGKLMALSTAGLLCPRSTAITADGGQ